MNTYFVLASFRAFKNASITKDIIKVDAFCCDDAESKIRSGYENCTSAIAFETMDKAKWWL